MVDLCRVKPGLGDLFPMLWRVLPVLDPQVDLQTVLYCTVLYCTVLYCTVLYWAPRWTSPSPGTWTAGSPPGRPQPSMVIIMYQHSLLLVDIYYLWSCQWGVAKFHRQCSDPY